MKPVLSLVVLGFRNFETVTKQCLESLIPWANDPAVEIFVVDNGSPDNSATLTENWCLAHPGFHHLLSERNRGFAGGMNWGASHAQGEWLFLVNNDTVFPAGALDALLSVLQETPKNVAMLGPVTNAAGNGQRLWKPGATHADWMQIGKALHANPSHQLMPTYRCDFFCIAIRKNVWIQLGGLDLSFGLGYYEDFDFSLRMKTAGYEQMITEDVFILHVGSASFKGSETARALIKKNKKILRTKHPSARFEHTRVGNLAVLERYVHLMKTGFFSASVRMRAELRVGALSGDAPRSLIKRWLWRRKSKRILGEYFE
jgi:GT2 family glycosyltransferase